MTTAEYLQTPETVLPRELAYGELRVADAPTPSHQRAVLELALVMAPYVRSQQLGEVFLSPIDVVLDVEAALVVQPDLLFVPDTRAAIVRDRVYGAPDLVAEVLSPHPRIGRLEEHVGWFARYGVRECWLLDIVKKEIVVLSLGASGVGGRELSRGSQPVRTKVVEGLAVTPLRIFGW